MTPPIGPSVAEKLIGRTMDGKYRVDAFIGRGAMGLVFRATQLDVDKRVALKIMRSDVMADETALQRFYREARATSRLNHPNTIKVFESGQFSEGYPYIAMEFLDGEPLHKVIAEQGPLPAARVVKIVLQVAKALAEAHNENIVHRDLKPGNIMVLQLYGEPDFVKVLDFGIAKILTDSTSQQLTQAGFALGTPHYMSPEQAKGRPLDARSDLYSLGVILFEMLTGHVPFKGDSSVDVIMKHISAPVPKVHVDAARFPYTAQVAALVDRLLEKDREKRLQSSLDLIRILEPLHLEGERMALEGRIERVPRVDASAAPAADSERDHAVPGAAEAGAPKTMALNADDMADLGIQAPSRPAELAPPPSSEPPIAADAQPAEPADAAFAEKTMALSAADVLNLLGGQAGGPVDESTQLFDVKSAGAPVTAKPSGVPASAPGDAPAPASAADGPSAECTALFAEIDASVQPPAPAEPVVAAPAASPASPPEAEPAVSQEGATVMLDANQIFGSLEEAPSTDQESRTVMLDAAAMGFDVPAPGQREEGTLPIGQDGLSGSSHDDATAPGIPGGPVTDILASDAGGRRVGAWLVWTLVGAGVLAVAVVAYVVLHG